MDVLMVGTSVRSWPGWPGHLPGGATLAAAALGEHVTADRPTGHRMRCPVCGSRKVIPSLGRLSRRRVTAAHGTLPIAGASVHAGAGDVPSFAWRCRVCRTAMRAARAPLWRRRKPLSSWMLSRGTSGRAAGV
jgi:hypothetical protein